MNEMEGELKEGLLQCLATIWLREEWKEECCLEKGLGRGEKGKQAGIKCRWYRQCIIMLNRGKQNVFQNIREVGNWKAFPLRFNPQLYHVSIEIKLGWIPRSLPPRRQYGRGETNLRFKFVNKVYLLLCHCRNKGLHEVGIWISGEMKQYFHNGFNKAIQSLMHYRREEEYTLEGEHWDHRIVWIISRSFDPSSDTTNTPFSTSSAIGRWQSSHRRPRCSWRLCNDLFGNTRRCMSDSRNTKMIVKNKQDKLVLK